MKLDLCGVKLSLRQWSHFTVAERRDLIKYPVTSLNERAAYHALLLHLIRTQTGEEPKFLQDVNSEVWEMGWLPSSPHGIAMCQNGRWKKRLRERTADEGYSDRR
ncbi:nitrate reductase associated protein, partial [Acetobacter fallax]